MVAGAYWWVQHFYRCSSRELQRIESLRSVLLFYIKPHCYENPIYEFLFWELHGLSPNFHIHVSVIYIFPGSIRIFPAPE
jgi:hypothetical protein